MYVAGSATRNVPPALGAAGDKGVTANVEASRSEATTLLDILREWSHRAAVGGRENLPRRCRFPVLGSRESRVVAPGFVIVGTRRLT